MAKTGAKKSGLLKRYFLYIVFSLPVWIIVYALCLRTFDYPQQPFKSDGCSMVPDGPHYECCYAHDQAYWQGGAAQDRLNADQEFKICVADISGQPTANIMYYGVRVGGHPIWPTPWRWDFGRPYTGQYSSKSSSKKAIN